MEIKATLQKPYTDNQRVDFIVTYNHNQGYVIEETETELQALGYTEEEIALQEKERIAKLSLTKREVFLGLYQAKGISPDVIRQNIKDTQALIEFDYANSYYRGNPLIDSVGAMLGITPEQLDKFFDEANKGNVFAWAYLMPPEPEEPVEDDLLVENEQELPTDEIVEQEGNAEVEE